MNHGAVTRPSAAPGAGPARRPAHWRTLIAACAAALLASCGGGGGGDEETAAPQAITFPNPIPSSRAEAIRFLTQATFGPTEDEIERVQAIGMGAWIDEQLDASQRPVRSLRQYWDEKHEFNDDTETLLSGFYMHALDADVPFAQNTQLRDRVAFALSEIFVVSIADNTLLRHPRLVADYYDMLATKGLTSYRNLLEGVTLHPAMGIYLSHLGNAGEDAGSPGRVPDQNFAREILQLFSIGLYELSPGGALKNGIATETYGPNDIKGLSRVFTGFSWAYNDMYLTDVPRDECATSGAEEYFSDDAGLYSRFHISNFYTPPKTGPDGLPLPDLDENGNQRLDESGLPLYLVADDVDDPTLTLAMQPYNCMHSRETKTFLGVTLSGSDRTAVADLTAALDRLSNHDNTAPFISKQLIQRFVTSNPSPTYVSDVVKIWKATNGDMKSVMKAILLHKEARDLTYATGGAYWKSYGKVREPVLRLTTLLRAFGVRSLVADRMPIGDTDDSGGSLSQTPLKSPSVFNFFRPGFVPSDTGSALVLGSQAEAAARGMDGYVAPEMQLVNESSLIGYANYVEVGMKVGFGPWVGGNVNSGHREVRLPFNEKQASTATADTSAFAAYYSAAANSTILVNYVSEMLLGGQTMSSTLRGKILEAVNRYPTTGSTAAETDANRRRRMQVAVFLTMISPEFLVQK